MLLQNKSDCVEWTKYKNKNGYGVLRVGNKNKLAHRHIWEESFGTIQGGLCVCHKCDNPSCINIEHLFLGTHADNMRDMANKKRSVSSGRNQNTGKKVCKSGHEFTKENTYIEKNGRHCRRCRKISKDKYNMKIRKQK